jgi:hypothetical protein
MNSIRRRTARIATACVLAAAVTLVPYRGSARAAYREDSSDRTTYNTEYIFATTRAVHEMDAPAAVRVGLFPVTFLVDLVLLPAEVIGGFF